MVQEHNTRTTNTLWEHIRSTATDYSVSAFAATQ